MFLIEKKPAILQYLKTTEKMVALLLLYFSLGRVRPAAPPTKCHPAPDAPAAPQ